MPELVHALQQHVGEFSHVIATPYEVAVPLRRLEGFIEEVLTHHLDKIIALGIRKTPGVLEVFILFDGTQTDEEALNAYGCLAVVELRRPKDCTMIGWMTGWSGMAAFAVCNSSGLANVHLEPLLKALQRILSRISEDEGGFVSFPLLGDRDAMLYVCVDGSVKSLTRRGVGKLRFMASRDGIAITFAGTKDVVGMAHESLWLGSGKSEQRSWQDIRSLPLPLVAFGHSHVCDRTIVNMEGKYGINYGLGRLILDSGQLSFSLEDYRPSGPDTRCRLVLTHDTPRIVAGYGGTGTLLFLKKNQVSLNLPASIFA